MKKAAGLFLLLFFVHNRDYRSNCLALQIKKPEYYYSPAFKIISNISDYYFTSHTSLVIR